MSELFQVKCLGQDNKDNVPILSGTSFGYVDQELVFELRVKESETPLRISFHAIEDKQREKAELTVGVIKNNALDLYFYNPPAIGTCGLTNPISLLKIENNLLGFMFHIERLFNSKCYRMSYEFYHGKAPKDKGVAK